jgi:hypothetical protein
MSEKSLESKSSSAKSDSSAALLADAQSFRLELNSFGTQQDPGASASGDQSIMQLPVLINDKLNQVNSMSAKDRATWLSDFKSASADPSLSDNPMQALNASYAPVHVDIATGSNGKANNFEITTQNYGMAGSSPNDSSMQAATGVLDGTVGAGSPVDVHFNARKTDSQFITNEVNGFKSTYGGDQTLDLTGQDDGSSLDVAGVMDDWAAEVQAMTPSGRAQMVQASQQLFPEAKWNTDAQGNITDIDFAGQKLGPAQWNSSVSSEERGGSKGLLSAADQMRQQKKGQTVASDSDTDYSGYNDDGSDANAGAGSGSAVEPEQSYIPDGTVVQGVGDNPGLYISNGDGTVSAWSQ